MDYKTGHRSRIREKLLDSKVGTLQNYEILELLLCYALPRKDTKVLAKELLQKYDDSIAKVINAEPDSLMDIKGININTVAFFKTIIEVASRINREEFSSKPILSSWQSLISYCNTIIGHNPKEMFIVFYLDNRNRLKKEDIFDYGTVDEISVYPREIAKKALFLNATAIILAHNHPGGSVKPSKADIEITQKIVRALEPFQIKIHDHLILSGKEFFSFKGEGLL